MHPPDGAGFPTTEEAVAFLGDILDAATGYSMIATDSEGQIVLWNEGARSLYGYEPWEIVGQPHLVLHTEEDVRAGLPQQMMDAARRDGKW